jgi:hypothetical protein
MDGQQFISTIRNLHATHAAKITFAKSGVSGLQRLRIYIKSDTRLRISTAELAIMIAVNSSRDWGSHLNRSYTIAGLQHLDDNVLYQIARDIEKVEASSAQIPAA